MKVVSTVLVERARKEDIERAVEQLLGAKGLKLRDFEQVGPNVYETRGIAEGEKYVIVHIGYDSVHAETNDVSVSASIDKFIAMTGAYQRVAVAEAWKTTADQFTGPANTVKNGGLISKEEFCETIKNAKEVMGAPGTAAKVKEICGVEIPEGKPYIDAGDLILYYYPKPDGTVLFYRQVVVMAK